ncbi:unnamed protein product [Tuber aestivum]|uniref:WHI2-like protein P4H10.16c n=1 Tax=Tuber aestivum TaxID=59557 RepID=A0A292PJ89_9PEZI|nr:unnamed protein product [Tuber aestivum]
MISQCDSDVTVPYKTGPGAPNYHTKSRKLNLGLGPGRLTDSTQTKLSPVASPSPSAGLSSYNASQTQVPGQASSSPSTSLALDPSPYSSALSLQQSGSWSDGQEDETDKPPESSQVSPSYSNQDPEPPPPPYTESSSPICSFAFCMATAGGSASIITQVQQGGPPPLTTLGGRITCHPLLSFDACVNVPSTDTASEENLTLDLRGTQFVLSRDELLTLPEFVLLSLFPNGLFPDGQMNSFHDEGVHSVDFDPVCLQYMLDFFRQVSSTITASTSGRDDADVENGASPSIPTSVLQDRAGIIVLREDLDFYVIPPRRDISHPEMVSVKQNAGKVLLKQDGIFSGLRRTDDAGTTEQHLIEMLTAGGFNTDDRWGHRAGEPNKAVICSLALARLRTDMRSSTGDGKENSTVGMAQKLLLFWRKPARRCWWEGIDLEGVEGVDGKLKVWIRRVWTLEMVCHGRSRLDLLRFQSTVPSSPTSRANNYEECYRPALRSLQPLIISHLVYCAGSRKILDKIRHIASIIISLILSIFCFSTSLFLEASFLLNFLASSHPA